MNIKKVIAVTGMASLMLVGVASAQGGRGSNPPGGFDRNGFGVQRGMHLPEMGFRGNAFGLQSELILEYTGLTAEELQTNLMDGATVAELIEANDQSVDDYIAAVLAEHEERLQTAVDERLARLEENLTAQVNSQFTPRAGRGGWWGEDSDSSAETTPEAEVTTEPDA